MYDDNDRDIAATLSDMQRRALERCKFNQLEAKERMKTWLKQDTRFSKFNPDALVERVNTCKGNGAVLDLSDPVLKGGQPRLGSMIGRSGRV